MKEALIINAVNPSIGGVLIKGERGTGKSTAARALADLLPEIEVVADCPFSCPPDDINKMCKKCAERSLSSGGLPVQKRKVRLVELPLNTSEDRLVGTLDIEKAIKHGEKSFEPGILARANRSILYIDEVNLLDDHIVDLLLDAAAMGVNSVEREGVSFCHPSHFIMIGTMNPEEGELRPQLEDRFGLCVEVTGEKDSRARAEVIRRMRRFTEHPLLLRSEFQEEEEQLKARIQQARQLLGMVELPEEMLELITFIAVEFGVSGHRADITMMNASVSMAALEGSEVVEVPHVRRAAELSLPHRLRKGPFDEGLKDIGRLDHIIEKKLASKRVQIPAPPQLEKKGAREIPIPKTASEAEREERDKEPTPVRSEATCKREETAAADLPKLEFPHPRGTRNEEGRRTPSLTESRNGKYVGFRIPNLDRADELKDIAFDATIRAAASRARGSDGLQIGMEDLRSKVRKRKVGNLIIFVVDASASMGAQARMEATKEAILALLKDAYQKRDRVGMITFKDDRAILALQPTSSVQLASMFLKELTTGGATPLSHGLALCLQVARRERKRDPEILPIMVLITDGHGNVVMRSGDPLHESLSLAQSIKAEGIRSLVIDTYRNGRTNASERGIINYPARRIAEALGGDYFRLGSPQSEKILRCVEEALSK
jgi:magnesium chelatase subunit D